MNDLPAVLEALIFISVEPLTPDKMREVLPDVPPEDIAEKRRVDVELGIVTGQAGRNRTAVPRRSPVADPGHSRRAADRGRVEGLAER